MKDELAYQERWADFRRQRWQRVLYFVVGAVLVNLTHGLYLVTSEVTGEVFAKWAQLIIIAAWILGLLYLIGRINSLECPHCGKQFGLYDVGILGLKSPARASYCHNCKLPRYLGSTYYKGILKLSAFGKR